MTEKHTTPHILMIRPARFFYNAQTAVNNAFQDADNDQQAVAAKASAEFDGLLKTMQDEGIHAMAVNDTPEPATPDSIFPNNWISTHAGGRVFYYPMFAENRRLERKDTVKEFVRQHFSVEEETDLSGYEAQHLFMEGTGSMVLDRLNKIAYACLSPRTDAGVLQDFCERTGYRPVTFWSVDEQDQPIYHTNVMMAVGDRYVVICLDSVKDSVEREMLIAAIEGSGKLLVPISFYQMNHFAGNMLQVESLSGEKILMMSSQAYHSLTNEQIELLSGFNRLLHSDISTIEKNGGGSVRCMLAEIHLEPKS